MRQRHGCPREDLGYEESKTMQEGIQVLLLQSMVEKVKQRMQRKGKHKPLPFLGLSLTFSNLGSRDCHLGFGTVSRQETQLIDVIVHTNI